MGIRMDQFAGHCKAAVQFLKDNEVQPETCKCCGRTMPRNLRVVDHYDGMFADKYPLVEYQLKDGRTATEFHQHVEWSSGPVHFLGLRVSNGTSFLWSKDEMWEWL